MKSSLLSIRKKLRLSQAEAGRLIGGGPRAFQKYESGDSLPSRAISSALMLLDHDPAALAVLKMHRKAAVKLKLGTLPIFSIDFSPPPTIPSPHA